MKQVSETLSAHLNNEKSFLSCDLYELVLKSGVSYYWAVTDTDVKLGGKTYRSNGPIITRNQIKTSSTVSVDKLTVTINCTAQDKIGGVPIMAVAHNGGFDGATLKLRRAFFNAKGVIDAIDLFEGVVEVKKGGGLTLQLDVKSTVQKLNVEYPIRRYYPQCPYCIYDADCGVDINKYRKRVRVTSVIDAHNVQFNTTFSNGYYDAGGIEWLDGALVGQVTQIIRSANNRIMYMTASDAMPQIGNEAYIYPGCDKTPKTCKDKFNNFNRNRATPYVPLKESIR